MVARSQVSPSDAELLEAWRAGQAQAGQELCERHYASVERFLLNKVGADQAVDLAQQTFVACVENRDSIRDASSFRAYLLTTAYHAFCAHLRRRYRGAHLDVDLQSLQDHDPSPSSFIVRTEEQKLLLAGLRSIPIKYQTLLELHYWEELSTPEIAEVLDLPRGTVRGGLQRARAALEARMGALARSQQVLESTVTRLDDWAARCRGELLPATRGH